MKINIIFGIIILGLFIGFLKYVNHRNQKCISGGPSAVESPKGLEDMEEWEFERLKDPATNTIPPGMRIRELLFAQQLPSDKGYNYRNLDWVSRGPYNVGGRTRAFAMDVNNENIMIAGGVSAGIWRTTDGGTSWNKISPSDQLLSVSCIAQDTRSGKTNTWYYGSGEAYGNSASATGAYFFGNGVYKSTDNGLTWSSLPATASNTAEVFDSVWQVIWNICIDPGNSSKDIVYAATLGAIYRSENGGNNWKIVLGSNSLTNYSYFTDVAITSKGVVYATLSDGGFQRGIWRSADGINWTNIISDSFPSVYDRIVIGINPSNENEVYFLAHTTGSGKLTLDYYGNADWNSLWKYTYLTGNEADTNGKWVNLSNNMPSDGTSSFDNFNAQGSYNMVVKVKPDQPNVVFICGTNIYRSTDGFQTSKNTTQLGGYKPGTKRPKWETYPNHHPDQHDLFFLPSNPNVMFSSNDGGVFRTDNCMASNVTWTPLNQGYLTTQTYTLSADQSSNNDIIVAGFQDNGNYFTSSSDPKTVWTMPYNGDGAFSAIAPNCEFYIFSIENGKMCKMNLDNNGNSLGFSRIDPIGGSNYEFVNPFVLDPNDKNILYLAAGRKIWRNDSISFIPYWSNYDSIRMGWFRFSDTVKLVNRSISAISVSKTPANRVYFGTNEGEVYRIDNANQGDPVLNKISTGKITTGTNVSCIAIDPRDANKVLVVMSNYNVYSLYYTTDGGNTWQKVAGNLEQNDNGTGDGPSLRWASILPIQGKTLYFVGTSVGLFASDTLISPGTQWVQLGSNSIGNVVVDMVVTRESDGLLVVGTHGNGIYSTHINSIDEVLGILNSARVNQINAVLYPNPCRNYINIEFNLPSNTNISGDIFSQTGCLIENFMEKKFVKGKVFITINTSKLSNGMYYCTLYSDKGKSTKSFIVRK